MELSIAGLNEWASIVPITEKHDSEKWIQLTVSVEPDLERYNRLLIDNDHLSIILFHQLNCSSLSIKGTSISHDCLLQVDFKEPRVFDEAITTAHLISRFFSFCNESLAEIRSLSLVLEEGVEVSCYGPFPRAKDSETKKDSHEIFLPFSPYEDEIQLILEKWMSDSSALASARDIISSLEYDFWQMPLELMFISVAQALESLTKQTAVLQALPDDVYKRYRRDSIAAAKDDDHKRWIEDKTQGNTKGQNRLLSEFLVEHDDVLGWVIGENSKPFARVHIATRNGYTHRDGRGKGDNNVLHYEDLFWHTKMCVLICKLVIAKQLGFDSDNVSAAIRNSSKWSNVIERAKQVYSRFSN